MDGCCVDQDPCKHILEKSFSCSPASLPVGEIAFFREPRKTNDHDCLGNVQQTRCDLFCMLKTWRILIGNDVNEFVFEVLAILRTPFACAHRAGGSWNPPLPQRICVLFSF